MLRTARRIASTSLRSEDFCATFRLNPSSGLTDTDSRAQNNIIIKYIGRVKGTLLSTVIQYCHFELIILNENGSIEFGHQS